MIDRDRQFMASVRTLQSGNCGVQDHSTPIDEAEALKPICADMISRVARANKTTNFLIDCHRKRSQTLHASKGGTTTENLCIVHRFYFRGALDAW